MTPQLQKLHELDSANPSALRTFDRVLVHFARAEGLLNDNEMQRQVSRALLNDLILELEPEDWSAFQDIVPVLGERHTRELMRYSLEVSLADVKEKRQEIEQLLDEAQPDDATPGQKRQYQKDREY